MRFDVEEFRKKAREDFERAGMKDRRC